MMGILKFVSCTLLLFISFMGLAEGKQISSEINEKLQTKMESEIKEELVIKKQMQEFLADLRAAVKSYKSEDIIKHFSIPCVQIDLEKSLSLVSSEQANAYYRDYYLKNFKKIGLSDLEFSEMELLFHADKIAIIRVLWTFFNKEHEPLAKLHVIYNVRKEANRWKIVLSIREDSALVVPSLPVKTLNF